MTSRAGGGPIALVLALLSLLIVAPPPGVDALRAVAQGDAPCRGLRLVYRDGSDALGWTTVGVTGHWGRVVRTEPDGTERTFRGRLPRGMCRRLARNAVDGRLWTARPRRDRGVDETGEEETEPNLRVRMAGGPWIRVSLPGFGVQDAPGFALLRGDALVIARHLSDGTVRY